MKTFQKIAHIVSIINNADSQDHINKAKDILRHIERNILPSGSGFDAGTVILLDECKENKIVLGTDFHHINEVGYYDGWTTHKIVITPCLRFGFDMRISGRDKRNIKEYIGDVFHDVLNAEYEVIK